MEKEQKNLFKNHYSHCFVYWSDLINEQEKNSLTEYRKLREQVRDGETVLLPYYEVIEITAGKTTSSWDAYQSVEKQSNFVIKIYIFDNEEDKEEFIKQSNM